MTFHYTINISEKDLDVMSRRWNARIAHLPKAERDRLNKALREMAVIASEMLKIED